jgi:hypothetical protein
MPAANVNRAIQNAMTPGTSEHAGLAMAAMNQRGLFTAALGAVNNRVKEQRDTTIQRKEWNRAEYGDDPNEIAQQAGAAPSEIDTRTPEGRAEAAKWFPGGGGLVIPPPRPGSSGRERSSTFPPTPQDFYERNKVIVDFKKPVGPASPFPGTASPAASAHSGIVNDRIGDIAQREQSSSMMNQVLARVLGGKVGGSMTVPSYRFGGRGRSRGA